ncbi:TetR/AcrR family transcriptional regulator [Oceanirhabdus seepicola]|uniref:TetR/AcrR family transcriptional regulator n=1 Tax=Oceanirhabdus seepicola TaxID=2828781 RepID=A0A9J6NXV1_9CLOT|nr:TetR/AcrR family transcriptional regulator [Oceanirhabdus seepicola]MCM1989091.1 TetR/AcrR family transcriptional regulator [Oceanirhabdus seepicola]
MDKRFEHIDINNEKIHKIINCAFEVFSKNDYEKASTNNVVKQAGISRGLLYHYFKDKQELFDFLVFFSIKVVVKDMEDRIDWDDTDILNRMRQSIKLKFELMERYPYMIEFFQKYIDKISRSNIRNQTEEISPGMRDKFYTYNIDFSQVKEGIDIEKMINVMNWTLRGKAEEYWDIMKSEDTTYELNKLLEECDEYIKFLRDQFFK